MDARLKSLLLAAVIAAAAFYGYWWWQGDRGEEPLRFENLSSDEFFDVYARVEPPATKCIKEYSGMLRAWDERVAGGVNLRDCRQLRATHANIMNVSDPCVTAFANMERLFESNRMRFESNRTLWESYTDIHRLQKDLQSFPSKANRIMEMCR